jgi:hypothetical protein
VFLDFLTNWFRDARGQARNGAAEKAVAQQESASKVRLHAS